MFNCSCDYKCLYAKATIATTSTKTTKLRELVRMDRNTYINRKAWDKIPKQLRKAILNTVPLKRSQIVSTTMFISDLEQLLRLGKKDKLADMLVGVEAVE